MGCVGRGGRGVASRPGRRKLRCEKLAERKSLGRRSQEATQVKRTPTHLANHPPALGSTLPDAHAHSRLIVPAHHVLALKRKLRHMALARSRCTRFLIIPDATPLRRAPFAHLARPFPLAFAATTKLPTKQQSCRFS